MIDCEDTSLRQCGYVGKTYVCALLAWNVTDNNFLGPEMQSLLCGHLDVSIALKDVSSA